MPRIDRVRGETSAIVHQATRIPAGQVAVLYDIPVAAPAWVVLQVAAISHPGRVEHVLDTLWAMRLVRIAEVSDLVDSMARQGRDGIVCVRRLLENRSDDDRPAESNNERRLLQIASRGGIRTLRRQVDVGGIAAWIGRVDFLDEELPLIVEVHSERYHTSASARRADAERIATLEAAGFTVVVVWDYEIWQQPDLVVRRIRDARNQLAWATA